MRSTLKRSTILLAVILMFSLFGCGKNKQFNIKTYLDQPKGTMLVDCFERTVGTPIEMPYFETVMYAYSKDQVKIERCTEGGTENEKVTVYLVPADTAQKVFDAIRDSGMNGWNDRRDTVGLNGKMYVCKFPDGKGGLIRVSSDRMPEDGRSAFSDVFSAMSACLRDEYRQP